jgi:hypothetical protein
MIGSIAAKGRLARSMSDEEAASPLTSMQVTAREVLRGTVSQNRLRILMEPARDPSGATPLGVVSQFAGL